MVHIRKRADLMYPRFTMPAGIPNFLLLLLRSADSHGRHRLVHHTDRVGISQVGRRTSRFNAGANHWGLMRPSDHLP